MKMVRTIGLYAMLVLLAAATVAPLVWMVFTSLHPALSPIPTPDRLFAPKHWAFENYAYVLSFPELPVARFLLNSVVVTAGVVLFQLAICSLAAFAFARLSFRGRDTLFLIFLLTSLCCIGIGMTVASITKTENQAEPLCWLFAMPLASLSGCWFSMEMMPSYLKNVAYAFPFAHTIDATRAILIRGVGLESETVRGNFLFLVGWAVAIFALGIILFRRSMRS